MTPRILRRFLATCVVALSLPLAAFAAGESVHLDRAPDLSQDKAALQNGARLFVNYCLNCHGLSFVRYQKLTELGLSEAQVRENLMFTADKIGELMKIAARPEDLKKWFGVMPPDLSLIARARSSADGSGADWLYTYLRSFYQDAERPTGWNNTLFPNVGMPHVFWELQGRQSLVSPETKKLELSVLGKLSPAEYDKEVGDLVAFLVWAAEPNAAFRKELGFGVIAFLAVFGVIAYLLKRAYWRHLHEE